MGVLRRIFGVLVVPVLVIGAGGAYVVLGEAERAQIARQTSEMVAAMERQDEVLAALARERALVIAAAGPCRGRSGSCPAKEAETELLRGVPRFDDDGEPVTRNGEPVYAVPSAQERTQNAIDARDTAFDALWIGRLDPQVRETIDQARFTTAPVTEVQEKVARSRVATTQVTNAYDMFLAEGLAIGEEFLRFTSDRDVALRVEAYLRANEVLLIHDQERALIDRALREVHSPDSAALTDRAREAIQRGNELRELAVAASSRAGLADRLPPFDGAMGTVRELIVTNRTADGIGVATASEYADEARTWDGQAVAVRDALRADAVDLAAAHARDARSSVSVAAGTTAVGVLAVIVVGVAATLRGFRPRAAPTKRMVSLDLTPVPGSAGS